MKNKKANLDMTTILIIVVFGIVAITVGWGIIAGQTQTTAITADTFTAVNNTCVSITPNCIASLTSTVNATGGATIGTGNFTLCSTTGDGKNNGLKLDGTGATEAQYTNQAVNASYDERSCQYISGMTGTIINYIPVLMALVLLVAVAVFVK